MIEEKSKNKSRIIRVQLMNGETRMVTTYEDTPAASLEKALELLHITDDRGLTITIA